MGIAGGIVISLISGSLQTLLGLDAEKAPYHSRSVQDWRKAKRKPDFTNDTASAPSETPSRRKSGKRKGKSGKPSKPPTILEELDSDY